MMIQIVVFWIVTPCSHKPNGLIFILMSIFYTRYQWVPSLVREICATDATFTST